MQTAVKNRRYAFGLFAVDVDAEELTKSGHRVRLQSQPFRVLLVLLENPGRVVMRDELQASVWGSGTTVGFDHSLAIAINKIREALGDSAENPRFVQTLARRGYKFIAPVHILESPPGVTEGGSVATAPCISETTYPDPGAHPELSEVSLAGRPVQAMQMAREGASSDFPPVLPSRPAGSSTIAVSGRLRSDRRFLWGGLAAALLLCALWIAYRAGRATPPLELPSIRQLTHSGHLASSVVTMEDLAVAVTDGVHLYATEFNQGRAQLDAISIPEGTVFKLELPEEIGSPSLADISPDGSHLLLRDHLSPESEQPLWIVPTLGGSALRVGSALAHDATWMPDGQDVLYANGTRLIRSDPQGTAAEVYATLPGRAFWLRWSPDGSLLRFTILDPLAHTIGLWQLSSIDRKPKQILGGFSQPQSECCGTWLDGGRSFVFQSSHGGNTDIWRLDGESTSAPTRVTNGPLEFGAPVAARTGSRVYFLGGDARSELDHLTPGGLLVPEGGLLSGAVRVEYSRSSEWVAWTDTIGRLWRARASGAERIQLTPDGLDVFLAQWSPDGSHLALMARAPGHTWRIYVVGADGSDLHPLFDQQRNAADPSWSADGNTIVFGRTNDRMGSEPSRSLELIDLRSHTVRPVPNSEGLFSPRWSPNGRYIVALSLDQRRVELLDVATQKWQTLPVGSGADPIWSPDSHSLFLHAALDTAQPILRVAIPEGHVQELVRLSNITGSNAVDYVLSGLSVDGTPLVRTRVYTGDLFSLELKQ